MSAGSAIAQPLLEPAARLRLLVSAEASGLGPGITLITCSPTTSWGSLWSALSSLLLLLTHLSSRSIVIGAQYLEDRSYFFFVAVPLFPSSSTHWRFSCPFFKTEFPFLESRRDPPVA